GGRAQGRHQDHAGRHREPSSRSHRRSSSCHASAKPGPGPGYRLSKVRRRTGDGRQHEDTRGRVAMQIGMIGLGRMGGNMVRRLLRGGHECVVYDLSANAIAELVAEGGAGAGTLDEFVQRLRPPRTAWIMVPAGDPTENMVQELGKRMEKGDAIVDGGNSYYKDDVRRSRTLAEKGIFYVDAGTSGGVWGLERGYCLMIG